MVKHLFSYLEDSIKQYPDSPGLSDIDGDTHYTFLQTAEKMARLNIMFSGLGLKSGDKIALCARNCADWAVSFLAIASFKGVSVIILPDFTPDSVRDLLNHSEAKLLIIGMNIWKKLVVNEMPGLNAVISTDNFSLLYAAEQQFTDGFNNVDNVFNSLYPEGFKVENVNFPKDNLEDLMVINYTSGSTGNPKGVMLTYKAVSSNVDYAIHVLPHEPGESVISILPLAHMFGLAFELLFPFCSGAHINFISKSPSPSVLADALKKGRPFIILAVPLVVEKIFKSRIFPALEKQPVKLLWKIPVLNKIIQNKIHKQLLESFGGRLRHLVVGGAALNQKVEECLKKIKFPFTVGYGMTECAPLIGYSPWQSFVAHSCGRCVDRMQVRIDSNNPQTEAGEIQVKGDNVMLGYYKNEEATKNIFTQDGWMHTGDLGVIDAAGNIFIRGRSKNMILGPSGQNIYPEEIEDKLNSCEGVVESVVVDRDGKLVWLVLPDYEFQDAQHRSIEYVIDDNMKQVNALLPVYSRLTKVELRKEEFEKTPKRSIRRFLYN